MIAVSVAGPVNGEERAVARALGAELVHAPDALPDALRGLVVLPAPVPRRPLVEVDEALWRRTLDANLTRAMELCRVAGPRIAAAGGGAIVLTTLEAPAEPGWAHLAAASGAVAMLARALAAELGGAGVRVNAVTVWPGRFAEAIPVLRLLLSEVASYVVGEVVPAADDGLARWS